MTHSFDVDIAKKYGVQEAIFVQNLYFWISKNKANGRHFHDGRHWTFNSINAWIELFPYFSKRQVERILKSLEDSGAILTGNYNASAYDRTKWYALTDDILSLLESDKKENCISQNGKMDLSERVNRNTQTVEPIPDINTDINTDNKHREENASHSLGRAREEEPKSKRFIKPTVAEVRAYCQERENSIDAQTFIDFYESKGWRIGKDPMKDWQASIRTWEQRRKAEAPPAPKIGYDSLEEAKKAYKNISYAKELLHGEDWWKVVERL